MLFIFSFTFYTNSIPQETTPMTDHLLGADWNIRGPPESPYIDKKISTKTILILNYFSLLFTEHESFPPSLYPAQM